MWMHSDLPSSSLSRVAITWPRSRWLPRRARTAVCTASGIKRNGKRKTPEGMNSNVSDFSTTRFITGCGIGVNDLQQTVYMP